MFPRTSLVMAALLTAAGCSGEIMGGGDDDDDDGGAAAVTFLSPAPGSSHPRDVLADDGWLVAAVDLTVEVENADTVEIALGGEVIGTVDDTGALSAELRDLGAAMLTARAIVDGEVAAEATLAITVADPAVADCHAWLDLYQLDWEVGDPAQGVSDNVVVRTPINGMSYRYVSNTTPRASYTTMHCELARSLARAAPILRERDIVEVADIGVYNYRCIGGGTPPDCPNGISQHAYAKAIDIAGFTDADGTFYSVNDDWVIDPDSEDTCTAPTVAGKDAFLHEAICALKAARVWNIVLTPNYNDAHRNHFHVDLTPNSDFIELHDAGAKDGVDVGPDHH